MKNYVGMKWNELKEIEKENLLNKANAVDGVTGNNMRKDGECIIDLTAELSVSGEIKDGEIFIDDAIIYNSQDGVIALRTPQEKWQKKVGLVAKSYKLKKAVVDDFAAACERKGVSQAAKLTELMTCFVDEVNKETGE